MSNIANLFSHIMTLIGLNHYNKTESDNRYAEKSHSHSNYLTSQSITGKEDTSNKVTSWSSTTTDAHYPSEKLVKSTLDSKLDTATATETYQPKGNYAISNHTHTTGSITDFPSIPTASSTTPSADTTNGSVGNGTTWAKADHTHPKSTIYADVDHNHQIHQVNFDINTMKNYSNSTNCNPSIFVDYMTNHTVTDVNTNDEITLVMGDYYMVSAWDNNNVISNYQQHSSDFYIYYCSSDYEGYETCELISQPYDIVDVVVTYTDDTTETLSLFKQVSS